MSSVGKLIGSFSAGVWGRLKDFFGYGGEATYLWPRWLLLRAVGLVYIVVFAGIIKESAALIGPDGLTPLPDAIAQIHAYYPSWWEAIFKAPTLFLISSHPIMPVLLEWSGMLAAVALVLNFWPRMMLFICWAVLLSFVRGWLLFSGPLVDRLMLEVALVCILFAPAGYRPGLGAHSSPQRIAVFVMRWLLFRVMFEDGISKLLSGDIYWLNFTALDVLYETAPSPTILGFFDHQMPHFWHVGEYILTFAAEIAAPLMAMFGGRRSRWIAVGLWTALQIGIQLTCNFGWLNTVSIALSLIFIDDQMLASAAKFFRFRQTAERIVTTTANATIPVLRKWQRYSLNFAFGIYFYLTLLVFAVLAQVPSNAFLDGIARPLQFLFNGFASVNAYSLYSRMDPFHFVAEFLGSNDGGVTWRTYHYRYFPQQLDRVSPFTAPWFHRFEANLQVDASANQLATPLYKLVATRLLENKQPVIALFEENPFPEGPPQMIRTPGYRYQFNDYATYRATGHYWKRSYLGEYMAMTYRSPDGAIDQASSDIEQVHVKAYYGNADAQTYLGFHFITGEGGVERNPAMSAKWFLLAAKQGVPAAQLNLSLMFTNGDGVPRDAAQAAHWCRLAAEQGLDAAQDRLGILYMEGLGVPRDPVQALAWFQVATLSGSGDAALHQGLAKGRLGPADVLVADQRAQAILSRLAAQKKKGP